jgi:hypothetical protein
VLVLVLVFGVVVVVVVVAGVVVVGAAVVVVVRDAVVGGAAVVVGAVVARSTEVSAELGGVEAEEPAHAANTRQPTIATARWRRRVADRSCMRTSVADVAVAGAAPAWR